MYRCKQKSLFSASYRWRKRSIISISLSYKTLEVGAGGSLGMRMVASKAVEHEEKERPGPTRCLRYRVLRD